MKGRDALHTLHNPNYKDKNPTAYLYRNPYDLKPTILSKSMSIFLDHSVLHFMTSLAAAHNLLVVPFSCFTWKRVKSLKEKKTFYFQSGKYRYFLVAATAMKAHETKKYEAHLLEYGYSESQPTNTKKESDL